MSRIYDTDTIAAIATAAGEGGISIIRVSGPDALHIAERIVKIRGDGAWESHRMYYGHVIDPLTGVVLDEVMTVLMKAPRSYTREDVLEIHCHGGSIVSQQVLELLMREGTRAAEPGEFTKRAFLNGRIDLTQAEAVIDLIRAKTPAGQEAAAGALTGRIFNPLSDVKKGLTAVLTHIEAYIDFPEEEIPLETKGGMKERLGHSLQEVERLLESYEEGKIYRDGLSVVIVGRPNAGKSSLLNILLKEKRAIVTSVPGTTRDVIEEYMNIRGVPLRLADTAGLRDTDDLVEIEGVKLTREAILKADLVLFVLDSSIPLTEDDVQTAGDIKGKKVIVILNKNDLPSMIGDLGRLGLKAPVVSVSASKGSGIDTLHEEIFGLTVKGGREASSGVVITRARHRDLLIKAAEAIKSSIAAVSGDLPQELTAIHLRAALDSIGEVVGETTPDEILNRIFDEFCIGK